MNECVLPCSPNWFLSSVSSGNNGVYAFGARSDVFVYDVSHTFQDESDPKMHAALAEGTTKIPKFISVYTEHKEKISGVCLHPDPTQTTCCSSDEKSVKLWDVHSLVTIQAHDTHKEKITCMVWPECDIDHIYTGDEKGTVVKWNVKHNSVRSFCVEKDQIYSMASSPHSAKYMCIGYRTGVAVIVDLESAVPQMLHRLRGHEGEVTSIAWSPVLGENFLRDPDDDGEGCMVATASRRVIKFWSLTTGKEIFYKRLPQSSSSRFDPQDPSSRRPWLDIHWPKKFPDHILTTSTGGEVQMWNLRVKGVQELIQLDGKGMARHTRLVFNITPVTRDGNYICSFSLDRTMMMWNLSTKKAVWSWSSFGGHVYCARSSLVDPGCVAIGVGDNMIRVWNQSKRTNPFDISTFFYGMRSKITCVCWHPHKEGFLAYGTDDGRVGVYNTLNPKAPMMSNTFHNRTVYVVAWGPSVEDPSEFQVYSVGDGTVLRHFISSDSSKKDAVNLITAIQEANSQEPEKRVISELSWRPDFSAVALGDDKGFVRVYSFPDLRELCVVSIHQKMINCIRWHPPITGESPSRSPCQDWVAIAGNDSIISVVDLAQFFLPTSLSTDQSVQVTQALRQLQGHLLRTTDICWSPHQDGRLVSAGYDNLAVVWDVRTTEPLATCTQHCGRLLTVLWSNLDPDVIMSGGCDSVLRVWKISKQPKEVSMEERKKKKKRQTPNLNVPQAVVADTSGETMSSQQEILELQALLDRKKLQLMAESVGEGKQGETTEENQRMTGNAVDTGGIRSAMGGKSEPRLFGSGQQMSTSLKHHSSNQARASRNVEVYDDDTFSLIDSGDTSTAGLTATAHVATGTTKKRSLQGNGATVETGRPDGATELSRTQTQSGVVVALRQPLPAPVDDGTGQPQWARGVVDSRPSFLPSGSTSVSRPDGDASIGGGVDDDTEDIPTVEDIVPPVKTLYAKRGPIGTEATVDQGKKKKSKVKVKSFFPVCATAANRGKAGQHEDILDLTKIVAAGESPGEILERKPHLGLYTDRLGAHRCLLQESEHHLQNENMEYHLQLELWRGNVDGAVQIARQRNQLSDWIVAMAPLASYDLWEVVSAEYADHLEEDGQYHKAATYLLAAQKVHQAIDLFRRHRLFREAVSLAKIRLSPLDPILEDLYTEWGQNLMKDGQFEQAAKCYLAMRQIQEAGKLLTRRHDQSSLKTACHINLLANEKQQGIAYGFRLFTQHLVMGEWKEAENFVGEHEALKVFLPLLHTHQLLVEQLTSLCPGLTLTQKPVTSDQLTSGDSKETSPGKLGPLEFLLDKSESDPVVPWEPHVIGEHTFPHHVLRTWCQNLDMGQLMREVKATHAAIAQMASQQQGVMDVPTLVFQVSVELTLCVLSLLCSETSASIQHLLHTLASLYQGNHKTLMQGVCRLMLPQGPRYMLKLQQEFNASRVLITMENNGDLDKAGGEGHTTIKKYLTEVKDDGALSTPSSRCRELDCVRAYYYLAILDYLRDSFPGVQSDEEGSHDGMPNGVSPPESGQFEESVADQNGHSPVRTVDQTGDAKVGSKLTNSDISETLLSKTTTSSDTCRDRGMDSDKEGKEIKAKSSNSVSPKASSRGDVKNCDSSVIAECPGSSLSDSRFDPLPGIDREKPSSPSISSTTTSPLSSSVDPPIVPSKPGGSSLNKTSSTKTNSRKCSGSSSPAQGLNPAPLFPPLPPTNIKGQLNYKNLLRLSRGILWDVQAKREALTETLGYVHRSISQHLLANRSTGSNPDLKDTSQSSGVMSISVSSSKDMDGELEEDGSCQKSRLSTPESPFLQLSNGSRFPHMGQLSPTVKDSARSTPVRSISENLSNSPSSRMPKSRSISESNAEGLLGSRSDPTSPIGIQVERDLLGSMSDDIATISPKSRKVLWLDGRGSSTESLSPNSLSHVTRKAPDGTSIPLEWDDLAVDVKYSQPYVTLTLLRQEQESIAQELKRVPDVSKAPFPTTNQSVRKLLDACLVSPQLSIQDKKSYVSQLNDWASLFAVTTQQKLETDRLFAGDLFAEI